ncbi:indolepyruvate oxidoreductase subunit beta [Thiorhodovibrio winogradskyi]|uniref:Indolepyruvate oxidoreductase subunit beta n=1 Tax=Thiorhodovibrio winogradskyi TaxID=77007 RepID=A0ABZ0S9H5_9GAMM|nr:4Fe-4S binding protein [Thiorhodovibrio winogradskyi]
MAEKISIRMSGLGGQGVVTAAHILGMAAYKDDLQVTTYCEDRDKVTVDQKRCKGCGICITLCTKDAMSVKQVSLNG